MYVDYYTFTVNSIAEKLYRSFNNLIENNLDIDSFISTLNFLEKFVQIKSSFLKEFCFNKVSESGEINQSHFHFDKFSSFGTYFFNNLKTLIDFRNHDSELIVSNYNRNKTNRKKEVNIVWNNSYSNHHTKLDKFFSLFFNSKLLSWKTSILNTRMEKDNTCRVCEKTLSSKDFILHSWICKEIKSSIPKLTYLNNELHSLTNKIEKKRNDLFEKENIFDSIMNFDMELKDIQNYRNSTLIDKIV